MKEKMKEEGEIPVNEIFSRDDHYLFYSMIIYCIKGSRYGLHRQFVDVMEYLYAHLLGCKKREVGATHTHTNIKFIKYLSPTVMIIDHHIFLCLFSEEGIYYKV